MRYTVFCVLSREIKPFFFSDRKKNNIYLRNCNLYSIEIIYLYYWFWVSSVYFIRRLNCNYAVTSLIRLVSIIIWRLLFFRVKIKIKFVILVYPFVFNIFYKNIEIEWNRTPFDSIESELVSGFNIEYHRRILITNSPSFGPRFEPSPLRNRGERSDISAVSRSKFWQDRI